MAYICYIYVDAQATPHMEVLPAETLAQAVTQARKLLATAPKGRFAEVWNDEIRLLSLTPDDQVSAN